MERCQVCGRYPAKKVSFCAHQGFVLFRRVSEISGVFCRDHALEAYYAARGATLKGMWFSPGSMVFGTLRSLYDSAKLLDLPSEVKDEPFMLHIVACPYCKQKIVTAAGPAKCKKCGQVFAVASCASCNTVHVVATAKSFGEIEVNCRACGSCTKGPKAIRNWDILILACVVAEASAIVASANKDAGNDEREAFQIAVCAVLELDEATAIYLGKYFDKCIAGKAKGLLQTFQSTCAKEFKKLMLRVALSVAQADGFVDEDETDVLCDLAEILGFDSSKIFEEIDPGTMGNGISDPWWVVLSVSSNASMNEVTSQYQRLVKQFHPDRWTQATEADRQTAETQMKRINSAFDRAQRDIYARDKQERKSASVRENSSTAESTNGTYKSRDETRVSPMQNQNITIAATKNKAGNESVIREVKIAANETNSTVTSEAHVTGLGDELYPGHTPDTPVSLTTIENKAEDEDASSKAYATFGTKNSSNTLLFYALALGICAVLMLAFVAIVMNIANSEMPSRYGGRAAQQFTNRIENSTKAKPDTNFRDPVPSTQVSSPQILSPVEKHKGDIPAAMAISDSKQRANPDRASLPLVSRTAKSNSKQRTISGGISNKYQGFSGGTTVQAKRRNVFSSPAQERSSTGIVFENIRPWRSSDSNVTKPVSQNIPLSEDYKQITNAISQQLKNKAPKPNQPALVTSNEYVDRGIALTRRGFLDAAIQDFDKAILLSPNEAKAYHNRGVVRILKGQHRQAISDFTRAINLQPSHSTAYANRDLAYEMLGRRNRAKKNPNENVSRDTIDTIGQKSIKRSNEKYYQKRAGLENHN